MGETAETVTCATCGHKGHMDEDMALSLTFFPLPMGGSETRLRAIPRTLIQCANAVECIDRWSKR